MKTITEAAQDVVDGASNDGCSDDLTVTNHSAVEALAKALKKIGKTKPLKRALSVWKCKACDKQVCKNFLELAQEGEPMCSACDTADDEVMELVAVKIDGTLLEVN